MTKPTDIRAKPWVADSDRIDVPEEYDTLTDQVCWTSDRYIAHDQIQQAMMDPDVQICDIEAKDGSPHVYLQLQNQRGEQDFPTHVERRLAMIAGERFRQNDHKPGWEDETVLGLLQDAIRNLDNAKWKYEGRNDALATEEQIADALNYMLFALDLVLDEE